MNKLIIFLTACLLSGLYGCKEKEKDSLYLELKSLNELSLAEVRIQKTIRIDDPDIAFQEIGSKEGFVTDVLDWVKGKTTLGKRIGVYSFGTYFSAYMDLNDLNPEDVVLDEAKGKCTITLPSIQIKELGRDFEIKTEHERVSFYRSPILPEERAKAKNKASLLLSKEVEKNSLLKQELIKNAKEKAQAYFQLLLANWGYEAEIKIQESKL